MTRTPPPDTTPSFERSAKPLLLALKPSQAVRWFLIAAHVLAVVAVVISAIPLAVKALLDLLVAASLIYHLKQNAKATQLVWRTGNRWFINDEQLPAELVAINFFSRWLVIISLRQAAPNEETHLLAKLWRSQKFLIPFDALDADTFRLLRVRLRIEGFEVLNPQDEVIK